VVPEVVVPEAVVDWVAPLAADWLFKRAKYWKGLKFRLLTLLRLDTASAPFLRTWRTAHCPESYKNPSKFWPLFCD
jgi:hypothetical protein